MDRRRGVFVVIEGTDGSGKSTQFKMLAEHLREEGYDVATFDFPRYDKPSTHFVKKYLNGEYGSINEVGPYTASLFYALDRYEAAIGIKEALDAGKVVLSNRFTGANMAHQGTKFEHAEERRGYFIWLDNLEFEMLGVPRPDLNLVLRVPAQIAQELVGQKGKRNYTDKKHDLHEADIRHMEKAVEVYDDLCQLFPKDFQRIDCVRGDQLMKTESIAEIIHHKITPLLPTQKSNQPIQAAEAKDNPLAEEKPKNPNTANPDEQSNTATESQEEHQTKEIVTSTDSSVYAFTNKLNPETIAAAMVQLCRGAGDMRATILDEFAHKLGKDQEFMRNIITEYGDDSVGQLAGFHMVVEGASQLLANKLEWGRLAAYVEPSDSYTNYDQKDSTGNYSYYTPDNLKSAARKQYCSYMDQIFGLYSNMIQKLADYIAANSKTPKEERDAAWESAVQTQARNAARSVLPVASKSAVGIFSSGQALESLIMHLQSDELNEAQKTGKHMLGEARKVSPVFMENADKPERGGAWMAYRNNTFKDVQKLAKEYLPSKHADITEPVQLTGVWPRNELDLVPDMLYEHSDLPLSELRKDISGWPYDKKLEVFEAYMGERLNRRHRPGRALEKAHYSWDIVCDYDTFRDLQRHRMVDDLTWQELTPRYGYGVPDLIEEAGLTEQFEECFDISLKLHSLLQQMGYPLEAQYATLLGHKTRWKVTYNAREAFHLHELRTNPRCNPSCRKLAEMMHEKLSQAHPLLGEAMRFVNQDEDPELTHLAAERYTQFQLNQLEK